MKKTQNTYKEEQYLRAKKRLDKEKGFYHHLLWYVLVNVFIIGMKWYHDSGDFWDFGTFATAVFWGIGLVIHAFNTFGVYVLFSKEWEERKIKEFIEKDKKGTSTNRWE
ncbi:MAG: 2TM domain-containing protein [Flavobacteriaceae bacterium]|nr:2TM domain-containing protein [Flavobacteriaceae bacterium]